MNKNIESEARAVTRWQHREKLEYACTTTKQYLYKASRTFLKIAGLNSVLVITIGGTAVSFFGTTCTNLTIFVASCNELAKHFYLDAHLQYLW